MTDYSNMSDFEINKAVGLAVGYATGIEPCFEVVIINKTGRPFDPCNNPADAWPIIVENRISIKPEYLGGWRTYIPFGWGEEFLCINKNPLRAAMVSFLMMKEAEQCSS